jgi:hypothetical protein
MTRTDSKGLPAPCMPICTGTFFPFLRSISDGNFHACISSRKSWSMSNQSSESKVVCKIALGLFASFLVGIGLATGSAQAEGRCPAGQFPIGGGNAGWEGCAPMGPGNLDNGGHKEPAEEWETRWGAVATTDGAMGIAESQRSKKAAEVFAIEKCTATRPANTSRPCTVRLSYYNQCMAVAWGDAGSLPARAWGLKRAENLAMETCKKETTNCELLYSGCSMAVRVR